MPRLSFDSFEPGAVTTYGSYPVTRDEIVAFASQYDPQPMHLDEAAAAGTLLGGLGSSGWHTCSMLMRMLYDNVLADSTGMGAGGIDEVKWRRPVRPGDVLSVRQTVLDKRASSRGDRGYVRFRFEVVNQAGDTVMEQTNSIIFGVSRPEAA
jgi:acyl dehydratase